MGTASHWHWHHMDPAMPCIHKESPQPLTKDQLGFPPGMEVRVKVEPCCLACMATSSNLQHPEALCSTPQHPAAPSSNPKAAHTTSLLPKEAWRGFCCAGPARASSCQRWFIPTGRFAVVGAVGNADMNLQLWIFFDRS